MSGDVAIKLAARPQTWYWLLPPDANGQVETSDKTVSLKELDFRVSEAAHEPLPPGVFRAVATVDEACGRRDGNSAVGDDKPTSPDATDIAIPAELLSGIEDNTIGVRRAEVDAYLTMLDKARRLPEDELTSHADDDVAFTVVMLQPDDYRGQTRQRHRTVASTDGISRHAPTIAASIGSTKAGCSPRIPATTPGGLSARGYRRGCRSARRSNRSRFASSAISSSGWDTPRREGQHVAPTLLAGSFDVLPVPVRRGAADAGRVAQLDARLRRR